MADESRPPFREIPTGNYVIGNPVRGTKMFFGRESDFDDVRRRLEAEKDGIVTLFVGGRRSGKTSIMFQIAEGRLGDEFLPVFVDMQAMTGLDSDAAFLEKVANIILERLDDERLPIDYYRFGEGNPIPVFDQLLRDLNKLYPDKRLILLVDEAEILRDRVAAGELGSAVLTYFSSILESQRVSFCLTGSNGLGSSAECEEWRRLMAKGEFREITFLSPEDARRLVCLPLEGYVSYGEGVVDSIYRMTHGHPYYTQIFCVNIVDYLTNQQRNHLEAEELEEVVRTIIDNTPPQLSYDWEQLDSNQQIALSLLSDESSGPNDPVPTSQVFAAIKEHNYPLDIHSDALHVAMESLFEHKVLERDSQGHYSFMVDLYRQWVQRARPVWRLVGESVPRKKRSFVWPTVAAVAAVGALLVVGVVWWGLRDKAGQVDAGAAARLPTGPVIGSLWVEPAEGMPRDVEILVDGTVVQSSIPTVVRQEVGSYVIELKREGYYPQIDTLEFTAGIFDTLQANLRRITGGLTVRTVPAGAQVQIRGEEDRSGAAPLEINGLPTGTYVVSVSRNGFVAQEETIRVEGEKMQSLDFELAARVGNIYLTSEPAGARIALNGKDVGQTTPALLKDQAVGKPIVTLELADYYRREEQVSVRLGRTDTLAFALQQLPATVELKTTPAMATIFLDGQEWGRTPFKDTLEAGNHLLRLESEGGATVLLEHTFRPGETLVHEMALVAEFGQVRIVKPKFGTLHIDGKFERDGALGNVPLQVGRHTLRIRSNDKEKTIDIVVKKDSVHKVSWE